MIPIKGEGRSTVSECISAVKHLEKISINRAMVFFAFNSFSSGYSGHEFVIV